MGTWGTAVFADDVALDVRDDWRDVILSGLDPDAATRELIAKYQPETLVDDESVFWIALAAAQMETGRLVGDVKARAIAIIDSGQDLERWSEEGRGLAQRRARVLGRVRHKLLGPQPPPKRLRPRPAEPPAEQSSERREAHERKLAAFRAVRNDPDAQRRLILAGSLAYRLTFEAPDGVTAAVVPGGVEIRNGDRVWRVSVSRGAAPTAIALDVLRAVQQAAEQASNAPWPAVDANLEAFLEPPYLVARYANEEPFVSVQVIWDDGWLAAATD